MDNKELINTLKKLQEELKELDNIWKKKRAAYKNIEKDFDIDQKQLSNHLWSRINILLALCLPITNINLLMFLIGILPTEIASYKLSDYISKKIQKYCEDERFARSVEAVYAKQDRDNVERNIYWLKKELESGLQNHEVEPNEIQNKNL